MHTSIPAALLLDVSTRIFRVGILQSENFTFLQERESADLSVLFSTVREAVAFLRRGEMTITSYLFCEGPGSLSPLRAGKMMIDCWNVASQPLPIYHFDSLSLAAYHLASAGHRRSSVILPTRRTTWILATCVDGKIIDEQTLASEHIRPDGETFFLPTFAVPDLPMAARRLDFSLADHGPWFSGLLRHAEPCPSPRIRARLQQFP